MNLLMLPLLVILLSCLTASIHSFQLTILHTNDVHSRIDEAHKYGGVCSPEQSLEGNCVGGAARLYTKIKEVRESQSNVLLLDGGDQFQGTFWFYVYRGMAVAQVMKKLGYDAMALGNHEFDNGLAPLQTFIDNVSTTFDVLSANIDNSNEPNLQNYKPYVVKRVGAKTIGIVGYTTTDTPTLTKVGGTGNLVFRDVVQSVRDTINDMYTNSAINIDIIIAVGHAGFEVDKRIAKEVDDVDVVVGGHTNTFLWTGKPPSSEKPAGEYPYRVTKDNGKMALCVQAYTFSKYLGSLTVMFDDGTNELLGYAGNPILLNSSVPKDPEIEAMLAPFKVNITEAGNKPIARTAVKLNADCREFECNFANFVADAWIHSNVVFGTDIRWARASIALVNGGSIRAPIEKGNITNHELLTSMPFGNDVVTVTVLGKTMKDIFEHSANAHEAKSNGRFLQMSGAQVKYDLSKPAGERVVDLKFRCLDCEVPSFESVNPTSNYTFLTSSFMAGGGDGYSMLVTERVAFENLGLSDADMVAEYMRDMATIYPTEEGRVQYVSTPDSPTCPPSTPDSPTRPPTINAAFAITPAIFTIFLLLLFSSVTI